MEVPKHLREVYNFLDAEGIGARDYCLLSNQLIGRKTNLQPGTVRDHLDELESLGFIIRTQGPPPGAFEPGAKKIRRIYRASHEAVKGLVAATSGGGYTNPPEGLNVWDKQHAAASGVDMVPKEVLRSRDLSPTSKLIVYKMVEVFEGSEASAPPSFYSWALGLPEKSVLEAFSELYDAGVLWKWEKGGLLRYGLISDLYKNWFYYKTVEIRKDTTDRIELLFKESVFGSLKGYKAEIA